MKSNLSGCLYWVVLLLHHTTVSTLAVGTQPVIFNEGYKEGGISLMCESTGWYPQPQVVWMDREGHILPAGHTETHTDSMDLFTVRQRIIVQETETNMFICRIVQEQLNEMKEAITNIPGEMFHRAHPWKVAFAVLLSLGVLAVILAVLILRYKKWQREKEFLKIRKYAVDVTLDPETAHPELVLSEDGKEVRRGVTKQDVPDNSERFQYWRSVLGKEGFSSGRHYWEVHVGDETGWDLGVARESIRRKEDFSQNPNGGLWALGRNWNEYEALTAPPLSLNLSLKPQKVGVFVDYKGGRVSFYSVEDESRIYTFTGQKFTEKLYPYFWLSCRDPLIICPVSHTD